MAATIANNANTAAKFHFLLIFRTAFLPSLGGIFELRALLGASTSPPPGNANRVPNTRHAHAQTWKRAVSPQIQQFARQKKSRFLIPSRQVPATLALPARRTCTES